MNKKLLFIVCVLFIATSYAGVVGIIPQGKKINGQMDKNTLVNVSRIDFVNFLKDGTIPSNIKTANIYYTPWATNPAVRKKFAKLLSDKLCQKMGITQSQLLALVMDELSVVESLQPGDTVYSNGIDIGKNQLVPAPPRMARMTSNGMEQILIFPDGTVVYMTCLNVDIADEIGDFSQIGEEGFEGGQVVTENETSGDTVYCVTQEHVTNVTDTIITLHGKIVQEVDTVHIKKEPVYVYKKEIFVTNQKKVTYVQEPDQVKKKIVYVVTKVGPDPCINCNEQQSYKINNNCPQNNIKINNNCSNTGNNQNIKIVNSGASSQTSIGTGNIKIVDGSKTAQSYGNIKIIDY